MWDLCFLRTRQVRKMRLIRTAIIFCLSVDNFILVSDINNQTRFLKPFDSALFLSKRSAEDDRCEHEPTVFTIHAASSVHLDPPAASTNVKLYIAEENNNIEERWYLRVHTITHQVSLECQSALDNVSPLIV